VKFNGILPRQSIALLSAPYTVRDGA